MKEEESIDYYETQLIESEKILIIDNCIGDSICTGDICCGSNFAWC